MSAAGFKYSQLRFDDIVEIDWSDDVSPEAQRWFVKLVRHQMPDITGSGQYAHYFGRVEQDPQKDVAGFCYAYCNVDSIHVEVAGIYVDENLRHRGIGNKLLAEAVKAFYSSMGSRSFALRFISEAARESSIAENIRRQFPEAFPDAEFTLYYPEDPRHERAGAGQLEQN